MASQLEQLKKFTNIVADSGDFNSYYELRDQITDGTTNPSLIYAASQIPEYRYLVDKSLEYARKKSSIPSEQIQLAADKLTVDFGAKILELVPGRVSTELDARLSFNTQATIEKAHHYANLYREIGIEPRLKVYFKIASTWEGIRAAEILEKEGYKCNLTLLFSFTQAVAAAEACASLISPFVGRILDYYKKETGNDYTPQNDPGVLSVKRIYNYYKKFGYKTIVMGASFRNKGEILELCGCDSLTISPKLLQELASSTAIVEPKLSAEKANVLNLEKVHYDEASFRWAFNEDSCAVNKLAEGIRLFANDLVKFENFIKSEIEKIG